MATSVETGPKQSAAETVGCEPLELEASELANRKGPAAEKLQQQAAACAARLESAIAPGTARAAARAYELLSMLRAQTTSFATSSVLSEASLFEAVREAWAAAREVVVYGSITGLPKLGGKIERARMAFAAVAAGPDVTSPGMTFASLWQAEVDELARLAAQLS